MILTHIIKVGSIAMLHSSLYPQCLIHMKYGARQICLWFNGESTRLSPVVWALVLDFLLISCQYLEKLQFLYQTRKKLDLRISRSLANLALFLYKEKSTFLCDLFSPRSRNLSGSLLPAEWWHCTGEPRCEGVMNASSSGDWPMKRNNRQNQSLLPVPCSQVTPNKCLQSRQGLEPAPLKLAGRNGFN